METNEKQLNDLLKSELKNQLSSEEEESPSTFQQPPSRSAFRKPIKNPFSEQSQSSDSDLQKTEEQRKVNVFPPKQPKTKSVLQQAQQTMKWNKDQEKQVQILSKLQGQGMKDKKIQQLAKKYKSLNIAYEKQKTLRQNLQTQLNNQLKINEQTRMLSIQKDNSNSTVKSLDKSQIKDIKCSNCSQNQKKIMDFRLQIQNIKTQLNKAHRLIAKQIGQDFNIDQALNQQNGWKGRQQKIQKLKGRIRQLQNKLTNNGVNVSHMSGFTQISSAAKTNANSNNLSMTRTSTMAENKRKQFENLKIQVDALKNENQLLQGKVKSLASRKINLEAQIKEIKTDYEKKKLILIQKSENDDKFINLLKNQNEKLKKDERTITKVIYRDQKDHQEVNNLRKQIQKLRLQLKNFTTQKRISNQKPVIEQKCLDQGEQHQERIQIKFPPTQKKKISIEKPQLASRNSENLHPSSAEISSRNQVVDLSNQKKKQLENQYVKGNKYLKKLTSQEEITIYQNWKSGKKVN